MLTALALKPLQPAQKVGPLSTQGHHITFEPLGALAGNTTGATIGTLGRNTIAFDHFATPPTHGVKKLTGEQSVTTLTLHVLQDRTKRAIPPEQVTSGDPIAEELAKRLVEVYRVLLADGVAEEVVAIIVGRGVDV